MAPDRSGRWARFPDRPAVGLACPSRCSASAMEFATLQIVMHGSLFLAGVAILDTAVDAGAKRALAGDLPAVADGQAELPARRVADFRAAPSLRRPRINCIRRSTDLGDQQLAGLLMITACPLSYVIAGVVLAAQTMADLARTAGARAGAKASVPGSAMRSWPRKKQCGSRSRAWRSWVRSWSAGLLFAWSGVFNVAASRGHWPITEWLLTFVMRNSVEKRSLAIATPALDRSRSGPARRSPFPWRLRVLPRRSGHCRSARSRRACCRRLRTWPAPPENGRIGSCSGSSSTGSSTPACRPGPRSSATTRSGRSSPSCSDCRALDAQGYRELAIGDVPDGAAERPRNRDHGSDGRRRLAPARAATAPTIVDRRAAWCRSCTGSPPSFWPRPCEPMRTASARAASCSRSRPICRSEALRSVADYYSGLARTAATHRARRRSMQRPSTNGRALATLRDCPTPKFRHA